MCDNKEKYILCWNVILEMEQVLSTIDTHYIVTDISADCKIIIGCTNEHLLKLAR